MDAGVPGLQLEAAASAGRGPATGGTELKQRERSQNLELERPGSVVEHLQTADLLSSLIVRDAFAQPSGELPPQPHSPP
jgi:hypothetical protein